MENSTEDSPLGKSPFAKDDPRFEDWRTASRSAREETARFNADHLKMLPVESEHSQIYTEWLIQGVVGRFDVKAKWFCIFYVFSYQTAERYEREVKALIEATLAMARQNSPSGIQGEYFLSELKIRLSQRQHHWNAEALRFAREAEQTKKEQQQPDGGLAKAVLAARSANDAVLQSKQPDEPTPKPNQASHERGSTIEDVSGTAEKARVPPIQSANAHHRGRYKPLPKPPSKVGGNASASSPSRDSVTGAINYNFPADFPASSRDRVKTAEIAAAQDINVKIKAARSGRELRALRISCLMHPARAFLREANRLDWGADRIDSQIRAFFLSAQIWAGVAKDSGYVRPEAQPELNDALLALLQDALPRRPDGGLAEPALTPETTNGTDSRPESAARAVNWDGIEITFLSDNRVQIRNGKSIETLNYAEFGFADHRSRNPKPNSAWVTLCFLSGASGVIPTGLDGSKLAKQRQGSQGTVQFLQAKSRKWVVIEKRVQEIRKALRAYFKIITPDPIPFIAGTGYKARFKINRGPSFDT
jgi:hypothetical protein